jgi:hypothetical protein
MEMMPHKRRKQRPRGNGDTGGSGGGESSGMTMTVTTVNNIYNAGWASRRQQLRQLAQHQLQ